MPFFAQDEALDTPLNFAIRLGHLDVVRLLVEHKANVNRKAPNGTTPLHDAAHNAHVACISILIAAGAHFRVSNGGGTPYHSALYEKLPPQEPVTDDGAYAVVEALARAPRSHQYLNKSSMYKTTALELAAIYGLPRTAELLLELKADVNASALGTGFGPLCYAIFHGHAEVAKVLYTAAKPCTHPVLNAAKPMSYNILPKPCTHPALNAAELMSPSMFCKLSELALRHRATPKAPAASGSGRSSSKAMRKWCKSIETAEVAQCYQCGMDSSPAGLLRIAERICESLAPKPPVRDPQKIRIVF